MFVKAYKPDLNSVCRRWRSRPPAAGHLDYLTALNIGRGRCLLISLVSCVNRNQHRSPVEGTITAQGIGDLNVDLAAVACGCSDGCSQLQIRATADGSSLTRYT